MTLESPSNVQTRRHTYTHTAVRDMDTGRGLGGWSNKSEDCAYVIAKIVW